ncbi:aldo/keto reductase family protein [Mycolicibacterium goodii]|uniref:2,5-diketo-D-gluconic acid reductase n=1 Tax=Mycolicibacterium goodii TaxID=134601 RepID=A0A0K0X5J6_MYCGD|nr:2,5-diketo-D-gluconic acid reductase [Mycolicibacterium goodii]
MAFTQHRALTAEIDIPLLGFGTYLIPEADTADAVSEAISLGYRHIDTAELYGNERGVGEGLRRGMAEQGLPRPDIFVTTKLWPEAENGTYKSQQQTVRALDESLDKLGLDYVDLYLIHAPFDPEQRLAQWHGLVELRDSGKARAIGVSNYDVRHIEELATAGLPAPDANQIELHPWSQKPALIDFLNGRNILPIAYSSLVPLSTWRAAPGHGSGKTDAMQADSDRGDSPFKVMAAKYGVTEAQLLLRWGVQNGYPVLPKSTIPSRIRANADLFSFQIDDEDMRAIRAMDRGPGVAWGLTDPITAP